MRNLYACFPAVYADKGDLILYLDSEDNNLPDKEACYKKGFETFKSLIEYKGILVIKLRDLSTINYNIYRIEPWGWDNSLVFQLIRHGVPNNRIAMVSNLDAFRKASSRQTSRLFFKDMISHFSNTDINQFFTEFDEIETAETADKVVDFYKRHRYIYVKAPWSSSGRGLIFTDELNENQIRQWATGIIRKQGSVIIEKAYKRVGDFSTEWILTQTGAKFMGYGMFEVSPRGKYHSNYVGTSSELKNRIKNLICLYSGITDISADMILTQLTALQKELIEKYFMEFGHVQTELPLGIDMFITDKGSIHPCVEINLRRTMGHVALALNEQIRKSNNNDIRQELCKFVEDGTLKLPEI